MHNSISKFEREKVDVHKKCVGYSSSVLSKHSSVVTLVGSSVLTSLPSGTMVGSLGHHREGCLPHRICGDCLCCDVPDSSLE